MPHGPVMLDLQGTELLPEERELLIHPATGGVILFSRNYASPEQIHRLILQIHALRSPHLLIAVDQEGGRVQRFREGFTRLPPMGRIHQHFTDNKIARHATRELGWLMASELRAVGVDFSFAPVLDINLGLSSVIGDRAFADNPEDVTALAQSWMLGAREGGMISVGKHFPGHGGVTADSHLELPIDSRSAEDILAHDVQPFRRLIGNGLEGIMPAHVIYERCAPEAAGFSSYWLSDVLRNQLRFQGVIFSDDLSMNAAECAGGYAERAKTALQAGCDMVLVCNNQAGAIAVLEGLTTYQDPVAYSRRARLHGRPSLDMAHLHEQARWQRAVELAGELEEGHSLSLNL